MGIATRVAQGRLEVAVVGIDRSDSEIRADPALVFRVDPNEDFPQQVRAAVNAVRPLLSRGVDVVVIASFDYTPTQRITHWVKHRLRAEGALAAMAREHSSHVRILTGREMAAVMGCSKAELVALASETFPEVNEDAAMASLTAEVLISEEEDRAEIVDFRQNSPNDSNSGDRFNTPG